MICRTARYMYLSEDALLIQFCTWKSACKFDMRAVLTVPIAMLLALASGSVTEPADNSRCFGSPPFCDGICPKGWSQVNETAPQATDPCRPAASNLWNSCWTGKRVRCKPPLTKVLAEKESSPAQLWRIRTLGAQTL